MQQLTTNIFTDVLVGKPSGVRHYFQRKLSGLPTFVQHRLQIYHTCLPMYIITFIDVLVEVELFLSNR